MAERRQSAEGLAAIFAPASVAVVGAGREPSSVGRRLLDSIVNSGYAGRLYLVRPSGESLANHPTVRTVAELPEAVDLAVVAVPADVVVEVAQSCGRRGVKALVVVSAGFEEAGEAGKERAARLREVVTRHHMRLVGPNCLGVINNGAETKFHATFAPRPLLPGRTAIMTQSGALGIALLEHAHRVGLGVSRFASMGNKLDVSGNDLLLLWEDDPEVDLILVYLESIGNPRNFLRIASRVGRKKPIVLLKGGRSAAGARAAGSHTGALLEADALVEALVEQCGILRAATVEQMFDTAVALAAGKLPAGPRVAVVTQSGGPAILATDGIEAAGLRMADLSAATLASCRALLPSEATLGNPLDTLAATSPARFVEVAGHVARDSNVDQLLLLFTPLELDDVALAEALLSFARGCPKPLAAVIFGRSSDDVGTRRLLAAHVPTYSFPENAVRALADLQLLSQRRAQAVAEREQVTVASPLAGQGWLPMADALTTMQAAGVPIVPWAKARDGAEAARVAQRLGFPVVLKLDAPDVVHKTEAGAVRLGLGDAEQLRAAYDDATARMRTAGHAVRAGIVMATAPAGVELLLGGVQDPRYGPVVAVGLGGIHAETMRDTAFRLAPLSRDEALAMLRSLRGWPLLQGTRGAAAADVDDAARAIVAFGRFIAAHPEVAEAEVNPLFAAPSGAFGADARIRVRPSAS